MISSLRAATRLPLCRRALVRPLATASDANTIAETFSALGAAPTPAPSPPTTLSSSLSTLAASPPLAIPPAEDPLLHKLASHLQTHGKRAQASRIVSRVLVHLHALTRAEPVPLVRAAVAAAAPAVRTMTFRIGAKTHYKPAALSERQRAWYALRWILKEAEGRAGRTAEERVAREIVEVLEGRSKALEKKTEMHKFAMVNRATVSGRLR